jgi:hypothetical protein
MFTITSCATQSLSLAEEFDLAFDAIIAQPDEDTQEDHNDADTLCFTSIL